jgi:hypothetical protein
LEKEGASEFSLLHFSHSDWCWRRRCCSALTPAGADVISVTCTAALNAPTVARLSRDDFTQIAAQRVSISIDIGLGLLGRAGLDDRFHETCVMELMVWLRIPRLRLAKRGARSWQDGGG